MTGPILAWHNDPALKADAVERMRRHREMDEFTRGVYIMTTGPDDPRRFIGCFHGCLTAEKLAEEQAVSPTNVTVGDPYETEDWWAEGERIWGIPRALGTLLDRAFESHQDDETAGRWAVAITEAIPVGADLSGVVAEFDRRVARRAKERDPALLIALTAAAPIPGQVTA